MDTISTPNLSWLLVRSLDSLALAPDMMDALNIATLSGS